MPVITGLRHERLLLAEPVSSAVDVRSPHGALALPAHPVLLPGIFMCETG